MEKILRKEPPLFILILLVSFASVSAVLFTPALPEIALKLGITDAKAQLTITVFLIGYALGILPYGPLSNRYGRKPTIYIGITLAIVGCLLILLVQKYHFFWLMILGRLLMALGSCVGIKIVFTIVGDLYQHEKATKIISYLMLSFAMVPAIAVAIGGFLVSSFGWMSCFYFLTGYSVLLLLLTVFIPETCSAKDLHALRLNKIAEGYLLKLKNKKLISYALMIGCGTSIIYLFAAQAPFIGINYIRLSPEEYGLLNFIPPIGLVIGSILANALAGKKDPSYIILIGTVFALLIAAVMLLFFLFNIINVWTLFIPMALLYIGESLIFANATSLAMTHAKNKSYASATLNFINMATSVFTLLVFQALPGHVLYLMPLIFTLAMVVVLFLQRQVARSEV